ncbi:MAG: hypothetical protein FWE21_02855 [Defluviitaleaceae bacterium]|nr:hypothetical protein [Defluviitaleaceae bacterium]
MFDFERENRHGRERDAVREHEHECRHEHRNEHEHFTKHRKVCTVETSEDVTITTPVMLNAYVDSCKVEIECRGHDIIRESSRRPNHSRFKIRQKMHVHIPIDFVAECNVGEGRVDFDFDEE